MTSTPSAVAQHFVKLQEAALAQIAENEKAFFEQLIADGLGWSCLPWEKLRDADIQNQLQATISSNNIMVMPELVSVGRVIFSPLEDALWSKDSSGAKETPFPRLISWKGTSGIGFQGPLTTCQVTAQEMILRLVIGRPTSFVEVVAVDFQFLGGLHRPYFLIPERVRRQITQPTIFREFLRTEFESRLNGTLAELGANGFSRVDDWNQRSDLRPKGYQIILIANAENFFEELMQGESANAGGDVWTSLPELARLRTAIASGACRDAGIFLVVCATTSKLRLAEIQTVAVGENSQAAQTSVGSQTADSELKFGNDFLTVDDVSWLSEVSRHQKKASPVPMPQEIWWKSVSQSKISVPMGTADDETLVYLDFGGSSNHALVGGMTGMGKSCALHTLILGIAQLYSPDEVKFCLIDLKDGTEFQAYRRLPHIYALAVGQNLDWTAQLLDELKDEMQRRNAAFRAAGVGSLEHYRLTTGQALSRILVVIDEFQKLTTDDRFRDRVRTALSILIQQGRSAGIHFVLSTQTMQGYAPLPDNIVNQLMTRIAFKLQRDDCASFLNGGNDAPLSCLRPGEAIFNDNAGQSTANIKFDCFFYPQETKCSVVNNLCHQIEDLYTAWEPFIYETDDFITLETQLEDTDQICMCLSTDLRASQILFDLVRHRTLAVIGGREPEKRSVVRHFLSSQLHRLGLDSIIWYGEWEWPSYSLDELIKTGVKDKPANSGLDLASEADEVSSSPPDVEGVPADLLADIASIGKAMMEFSFGIEGTGHPNTENRGYLSKTGKEISVIRLSDLPVNQLSAIRDLVNHLLQSGAALIIFDETAAAFRGNSLHYHDFTARLYLDETSARYGSLADPVPGDFQLKHFEGLLDFYKTGTVNLCRAAE
jgi:hypothetical protein